MRLFLIVWTALMLVSGFAVADPNKDNLIDPYWSYPSKTPALGGVGESCQSRADCESGLKCVSRVCIAPLQRLVVAQTEYEPSTVRIYAGPAYHATVVGGQIYPLFGLTTQLHFHPDTNGLIVLGFRGTILTSTDSSGWLGQVGFDVGVRPLLYSWNNRGVGLLLLATPGAFGLFVPNNAAVGGWHMGGLVGFYFDAGAFTMQVSAGPAAIGSSGVVAMFESSVDLGVRF